MKRSLAFLPILDLQAVNALEMVKIVGDNDQISYYQRNAYFRGGNVSFPQLTVRLHNGEPEVPSATLRRSCALWPVSFPIREDCNQDQTVRKATTRCRTITVCYLEVKVESMGLVHKDGRVSEK